MVPATHGFSLFLSSHLLHEILACSLETKNQLTRETNPAHGVKMAATFDVLRSKREAQKSRCNAGRTWSGFQHTLTASWSRVREHHVKVSKICSGIYCPVCINVFMELRENGSFAHHIWHAAICFCLQNNSLQLPNYPFCFIITVFFQTFRHCGFREVFLIERGQRPSGTAKLVRGEGSRRPSVVADLPAAVTLIGTICSATFLSSHAVLKTVRLDGAALESPPDAGAGACLGACADLESFVAAAGDVSHRNSDTIASSSKLLRSVHAANSSYRDTCSKRIAFSPRSSSSQMLGKTPGRGPCGSQCTIAAFLRCF